MQEGDKEIKGTTGRRQNMNKKIMIILVAALVGCLVVHAEAQSRKTVLKRKGSKAMYVDSALFLQSTEQYQITKGKAMYTIPADSVEYIVPPKPKGFDQCQDITLLEQIMNKYRGLWWDVQAFRRLMSLYINKGEAKKAVALFEKMKPEADDQLPIDAQRNYWKALRLCRRWTTLEAELKRATEKGTDALAACAYIARGNMIMTRGTRQDALIYGYLKTVILYPQVKMCRKEALEKTADVLEQLSDPRARLFRKAIEKEFPDSTQGGV
jgi:hypothetical protein